MPRSCQIVLFSATFADNVRHFAVRFAPNANEISLKREELSVEGIRQLYMDCRSAQHKFEVLCNLYDLLTIGQSIIFCRVSYNDCASLESLGISRVISNALTVSRLAQLLMRSLDA
jgi:superfamily II DNA/RNA helicase